MLWNSTFRSHLKLTVQMQPALDLCDTFEINKLNMEMLLQKQPPEVFRKKGVPRHFANFTGKHLCQNLLFNKVADQRKYFRGGGRSKKTPSLKIVTAILK